MSGLGSPRLSVAQPRGEQWCGHVSQTKTEVGEILGSLRVRAGHWGNETQNWKTGFMTAREPRCKPGGPIITTANIYRVGVTTSQAQC